CLVATIHFLKSLNAYGVGPARVVVCGGSVGGGLAALASRKDLPRLCAQILVQAALQALDSQLPSYQQNKNVPWLDWHFVFLMELLLDISPSWEIMVLKGTHLPTEVWEKDRKWLGPENIPERFKQRGYWPMPCAPLNEDAYLESSLTLDVTISRLFAEDGVVAQVPEAFIVACEYDLLREDSLLCKKRLEDLGKPVIWHHMEDRCHGVL
uniref:Alpha/beta hydrolase fold-3 domain-containing protein n=1 Tax=Loxodonta africana TaxID=9785 RepID=G3SXB1_LOXAF